MRYTCVRSNVQHACVMRGVTVVTVVAVSQETTTANQSIVWASTIDLVCPDQPRVSCCESMANGSSVMLPLSLCRCYCCLHRCCCNHMGGLPGVPTAHLQVRVGIVGFCRLMSIADVYLTGSWKWATTRSTQRFPRASLRSQSCRKIDLLLAL